MKDIWQIGQEFFRWEIATAVAGAIVGINPFDQPDVEASKDKTRALTQDYERSHRLPAEVPMFRENGLALYADPRNAAELGRHNTLSGYLRSHFQPCTADKSGRLCRAAGLHPARRGAHTGSTDAQANPRQTRAPPAWLWASFPALTQAYKGGPNSGVFLQTTCDDPVDMKCPHLQLRRCQGGASQRVTSTSRSNAVAARFASISKNVDTDSRRLLRSRVGTE